MLIKDGQVVKEGLPKLSGRKIFRVDPSYVSERVMEGGVKMPVAPGTLQVPISYTYFDKKDNRSHEMIYAETLSKVMRGNTQVDVYNPSTVDFLAGMMIVQPEQPELYEWFTHHPWNNSNPKRDESKRPIFYEVDPEKASDERIAKQMQLFEIQTLIFKTMSEKESRLVLKSYGEKDVDTLSYNMVKDKLFSIAQDTQTAKTDKRYGPEGFMQAVNAPTLKTRALIAEAQDHKLIQWEGKNERWIWLQGPGAGREIKKITKGHHYVGGFVEWLIEGDKSGVLKELEEMVEMAEALAKEEPATV